jgi:hypothetical protein
MSSASSLPKGPRLDMMDFASEFNSNEDSKRLELSPLNDKIVRASRDGAVQHKRG